MRTGTRANPSRQPQLGRAVAKKKKRKKNPTQRSRRHTLQFALAGSLHAVCNLHLICEPSKHYRGPWHSHHRVAWVVCVGGEVGVPHSFGREKAALFESLGKISEHACAPTSHHLPRTQPFRVNFSRYFEECLFMLMESDPQIFRGTRRASF